MFYQRPSAGVTPLATGAVLQGDLGRSTGDPIAERAGPTARSIPAPGVGAGEVEQARHSPQVQNLRGHEETLIQLHNIVIIFRKLTQKIYDEQNVKNVNKNSIKKQLIKKIFFFVCAAGHVRSSFPNQRWKPRPLHLKRGVLITGLPGNSKNCFEHLSVARVVGIFPFLGAISSGHISPI